MTEPDQEGRSTWGGGAGWSANKTPVAPEPSTDAAGASSPPTDALAVSSPAEEESMPSAEPSAPTDSPSAAPAWNVPPKERWDELVQQANEAKRERDESRRLAELAMTKYQAPPQPVVPEHDPWAELVNHPDPATSQFYQKQRALFQHEARQSQQGMLQAVDAGRRELAAIKIAAFRRENPEIKPGSPEEATIAGYVGQGLDLEMSKKLALYDRQEVELRALKSKQAAVPSKANANTERSSGIPAGAGLPSTKATWREQAGEILDKGGSLADVGNLLFGTKRRV